MDSMLIIILKIYMTILDILTRNTIDLELYLFIKMELFLMFIIL
jgi:hypothetical protein